MTTYSLFKCTAAALEDLANHSPDGIRVTGFGSAPAGMARFFVPVSLVVSDMMEPLRTVGPKLPIPHKLRSKAEKPYYKAGWQGSIDGLLTPPLTPPKLPIQGFLDPSLHLSTHPG